MMMIHNKRKPSHCDTYGMGNCPEFGNFRKTKVTVHTLSIVYLNLVGNKVRFANELCINLWLSLLHEY